jgi:hypothetical protein
MLAGWAANLLVLIVAVTFWVAGYSWLKGAAMDEEQEQMPLPEPRDASVRVLYPPYDQDLEDGPA